MASGWVYEGVHAMLIGIGMTKCGPNAWEGEIEGAHVTWSLLDGRLFISQGDARSEITIDMHDAV